MKKWYKSKVVWFNIVTLALAIINEMAGKVIPTECSASIVAIGNVLLRMITSTKIEK
jgi:hypothetical protein